jgi:hypothetical protein
LGPGGLQRQFLHAARLRLQRPADGAWLDARSALPDDLESSLEASGVEVADDRLPGTTDVSVEPAADGGSL